MTLAELRASGDTPKLHCGACAHFRVDADRNESKCKRIDHKTVQFHRPWFKSYDCNQHSGIICSDFEPANWCVSARKWWTNFDAYWDAYVEQWLNGRTDRTVGFFVEGNTDITHNVPLLDYVFGHMFDADGQLQAISTTQYVRDRKSPIGYRPQTVIYGSTQ